MWINTTKFNSLYICNASEGQTQSEAQTHVIEYLHMEFEAWKCTIGVETQISFSVITQMF